MWQLSNCFPDEGHSSLEVQRHKSLRKPEVDSHIILKRYRRDDSTWFGFITEMRSQGDAQFNLPPC